MLGYFELFRTTRGRISRKQYWMGFAGFVVFCLVVSFALQAAIGAGSPGTEFVDAETAQRQTTLACWLQLAVFLAVAWPAAALMIKRRHDRGASGMDVWAYIAYGAAIQLLAAVGFDQSVEHIESTNRYIVMPGTISMVLGVIFIAFALYMIVVLGFLKGNSGPNAYGPDPLSGAAERP